MALTGAERSARSNAKPRPKACPECGRINTVTGQQLGICAPCRKIRTSRFRPQTFKDCEHCGKRFGPIDYKSKRFCTHACRAAAQTSAPSGKKGRSYPHLRRAATKICACGKTFRAVKDTARRKQIYCTHTCYLRNRRTSHFENAVMEQIRAQGITIDRQARAGRWTFDGQLTGTVILVEADGDYWHRIKKVQARDRRKDAWVIEQGFILERVKEAEFSEDPMKATAKIVQRWEAATGRKAERAARGKTA